MGSNFKEICAGSLTPHLVQKIWGGSKLVKLKNLALQENQLPLGESWEVSCHSEGPCFLNHQSLCDVIDPAELPYIVKFIDTGDNLSVQVHPGDDYAREHENQSGKTECWLILDAEISSGIFLGLKPGVSAEKLNMAIKNDDDLSSLLNFFPVKRGDFFYVPAGSIHAIGKGVTLVEVQQSSGITYRVWDWNRVDERGKGRTLHIEKALEVINFTPEANEKSFFKYRSDLFATKEEDELVNHEHFTLSIMPMSAASRELRNDSSKHWSIISLEHEIEITCENVVTQLRPYSSYLVPKGYTVRINDSKGSFILVK